MKVSKRLARKVQNTEVMAKYLDAMENEQKKIYITGVAEHHGITYSEALELIMTDANSEEYKGFDLISEIYDLRRQGRHGDANALIAQHTHDAIEYAENNPKKVSKSALRAMKE